MKKCLPVILLFLAHLSFSQNPNIKRAWHWYFGNHAGIDFSNGTAMADTNGALVTSEGCASISDTAGNLLFYSDGRTVWNKLHQVMPNGIGLLGGSSGSSTQGVLIIPKPLSPSNYFIFTTDEYPNMGTNGMRYSIVDMNLDGGNGDIINNQKNILLFAPSTEKLAAINHCNDTCVWVIGHEVNNNHFRAYLVTPSGISTNSVISAVGTTMNSGTGATQGVIKFSPNGKYLTTVSDSGLKSVEFFNFDDYSGLVTNPFTIFINTSFTFAISFSPDNSKLYIGQQGSNKNIYQFDVSSGDSTIIVSSQTIVSSIINTGFFSLQNGPDGKIYVCHSGLTISDSSLDVIENPNVGGIGCNYQFGAVHVNTWQNGRCLPNFNESYFNTFIDTTCLTTEIIRYEIDFHKVFPNPARDWIVVEGKGIKSVEITNTLGSRLGSYPTTASALQHKIYLGSLSSGIYFLKINMIDERFSFQKLFLQN